MTAEEYPPRMPASQAAEYIGKSPRALWEMAVKNQIGYIRDGRKRIYEKEELDRWLAARRVPAAR